MNAPFQKARRPAYQALGPRANARTRPKVLRGAKEAKMETSSKNKPVIHETEVIVPLDPAHEEKPTLVERERIEKEQAEKEENQVTKHEERAVCPLPDEEESEANEEGNKSEEEEREREEIIK